MNEAPASPGVTEEAGPRPGWKMKGAIWLALALITILTIQTGLRGVDFGLQWDEWAVIDPVVKSVETGLFLPHGYYHYGSVNYDLSLLGAAAFLEMKDAGPSRVLDLARRSAATFIETKGVELKHVIKGNALPGVAANLKSLRERMVSELRTEQFKLFLRGWFLAVSWLVIPAVFLASLALTGGRYWEALAAAVFMAGSWEYFYHAPWVGPNTIMATWGALSLLFALLYLRKPTGLPLALSSIFAGLAFATKYPSGLLLLLPMIASGAGIVRERRWADPLIVAAVFFGTFFIAMPGPLIDPVDHLLTLLDQYKTYANPNKTGYIVAPGVEHLGLMLDYFVFSVCSRYEPLSVLAFALAITGFGFMLWETFSRGLSGWLALALFFVPVIYIFYLSMQQGMAVRNLMLTMPFLAVLAGKGAIGVYNFSRRYTGDRSWPAVMGVTLLAVYFIVNFQWQLFAVESIEAYRMGKMPVITEQMLPAPVDRLWVSETVRKRLSPELRKHVTEDIESADALIFMSVYNGLHILANRRGRYKPLPFGPFDVNIDYYPTWSGPGRPVFIWREEAEKDFPLERWAQSYRSL